MSGSERIDHAVSIVDRHMADAPVDVRIAWQTCRGAARRARRISSTTLPALAEAAQLAVIVRDAVRGLGRAINTPPVALGYLLALQERALVHAEQLTTLFRTGGGPSSEPPPPG